MCVHSRCHGRVQILYAYSMAKGENQVERRPATTRGLIREVSYLHPDEAEALAKRAEMKRVSKSEIIRRALRAYLGIAD
jgi:hypothetical protein